MMFYQMEKHRLKLTPMIKKYESQEMMIILNFSTKDISIDTFNVEVKTCISSSQLVNHGDRVKYIASKSAAIYIL